MDGTARTIPRILPCPAGEGCKSVVRYVAAHRATINRFTRRVSLSRLAAAKGTGSSLCILINQSAQGQTGSGIEFRAANLAVMVRIGSLEAQLNNR